jgi:predicted MFS family arabinose efflux permease
MLGMVLAGWLGQTIGWRWTFVALGLPGIVLAIIVRRTVREPPRGRFDDAKNQQRSASLRASAVQLWHCRTYRSLLVFVVVNGFVQYGLNQWWPSLWTRTFELSSSSVGLYLGVAIGVGAAAGLLIGGVAADRVGRRDMRFPLLLGAAVTCLAIPTALGSLWVPSVSASVLCVSLTALFWSVSNGAVIAAVCSVVAAHMRATAAALSIFVTAVLGFGLGPFSVGLLSDLLTPVLGAEALRYALLAPICLLPVMSVALYAAARSLPDDLRAVGALN